MNTQSPEKIINDDTMLSVHSIFPTIQGEGPFSGHAAVFIRLAGCNLQCPLCDTDYIKGRRNYTSLEIQKEISKVTFDYPEIKLAIITGGEPFRQNILPLVNRLLNIGFIVQIETNGTIWRELPYWNSNLHIICSPKTTLINSRLAKEVSAFKYVIDHNNLNDNGFPLKALEHVNSGHLYLTNDDRIPIYIQPADVKSVVENAKNINACKELVMKYGYILCLQIHKIIGVE
jgi:organic radical activating enzyme